jgi:nucleoside-diphosphate-sugar epimerase
VKVILAGCGFLGGAAADLFCGVGAGVLGLCATRAGVERLAGRAFDVVEKDITGPLEFSDEWIEPDVLVHSASSGRGGAEAYRRVYRDGLEALMEASRPRRVVFVGSTSVYGQADGSWVDEASPCEPQVETGHILLEAERLALDAGGVVLRLAGLYGPGRSVYLRRYLSGEARIEGERWVNQIHRDDAAAVIVRAAALDPGIYNVCDDRPATQPEVYGWIAEACGGPVPPRAESPAPRKRGNTNKRVSNAALKATGWSPAHPSYRHALPSLIEALQHNKAG